MFCDVIPTKPFPPPTPPPADIDFTALIVAVGLIIILSVIAAALTRGRAER